MHLHSKYPYIRTATWFFNFVPTKFYFVRTNFYFVPTTNSATLHLSMSNRHFQLETYSAMYTDADSN